MSQCSFPRVLRVWDALRTQQMEFVPEMTPGQLVYNSEKYDFSHEFLDPATMMQQGGWATIQTIAKGNYDRLELNEPTMTHLWRRLVPYFLAFRVAKVRARLSRSEIPLLVLYAIDNFDVREAFITKGKGPKQLRQLLFNITFRSMVGSIDRIVFGTPGAAQMYESLASRALQQVDIKVIPELDRSCQCGDLVKDPNSVLFVGALDNRKGILQLMSAWPSVVEKRPEARLVIVGKGRFREKVEQWTQERDDVTFVHDPERSEIHRWYRIARSVVLLSQPHPRWREQVGLPITEGLSHGCVIVASTETGVAGWLASNSHFVVAPDASVAEISDAVVGALDSPLSEHDVISQLPRETTRITADRWLMRLGTTKK